MMRVHLHSVQVCLIKALSALGLDSKLSVGSAQCSVHLFWVIRALAVIQGHPSNLYKKIWEVYKLSESHYKYNILLKKSLYHTKHHKTSYCCPEKTDAGDLEYGQKTKSKYIYRKSYRLLKMKIKLYKHFIKIYILLVMLLVVVLIVLTRTSDNTLD